MKYRDSRLLKAGDNVIRKVDSLVMTVSSIESYGQLKISKINCFNGDIKAILFNEDVE